MSTPERSATPVFDPADQEVVRYHAISSLAVGGLLAGLLSPLALLASLFWLAAVLAIALSSLALWRIASRAPDLLGRRAALVGLLLGVASLAAAGADDFAYRYLIRRQAQQFAQTWFDAVQKGEVYNAHHFTITPQKRLPPEDKLVDFYLTEKNRHLLTAFVDDPTMRTLFALGTAAKFRYYETSAQEHTETSDAVKQTFAVTYPDEQKQPKTFFVTLLLERSVDTASRQAEWTLMHVDGGVRPAGW